MPAASGSIISPPTIAQSTNSFAEESNLQWCQDLSGSKIAEGNHLCNVGPWQTDNIYEEDNLCNVVSTMLGQHCTEILSSQCCPNTSETMLCNVGLEHTNTFSQEKNLYNVVLICMCQHCTRKLPAQC